MVHKQQEKMKLRDIKTGDQLRLKLYDNSYEDVTVSKINKIGIWDKDEFLYPMEYILEIHFINLIAVKKDW